MPSFFYVLPLDNFAETANFLNEVFSLIQGVHRIRPSPSSECFTFEHLLLKN
jgi:hypothetical protein